MPTLILVRMYPKSLRVCLADVVLALNLVRLQPKCVRVSMAIPMPTLILVCCGLSLSGACKARAVASKVTAKHCCCKVILWY